MCSSEKVHLLFLSRAEMVQHLTNLSHLSSILSILFGSSVVYQYISPCEIPQCRDNIQFLVLQNWRGPPVSKPSPLQSRHVGVELSMPQLMGVKIGMNFYQ